MPSRSLYSYLLGLLLLRSTASGETTFGWKELSAKLPKGLSDQTATRSGDIVYLAGGCDAEEGNKWDEAAKFFLCFSISQAFFGFNLVTDTIIDDFPDMPIPRYRHAAVAANDKIWVVGGRDIDDNLIDQVDVRTKMHRWDCPKNNCGDTLPSSLSCLFF